MVGDYGLRGLGAWGGSGADIFSPSKLRGGGGRASKNFSSHKGASIKKQPKSIRKHVLFLFTSVPEDVVENR